MIKKIIRFTLILTFFCQLLMANQLHATSLEKDLSKKYIKSKLEERYGNIEIDFDIQNNQIIIYYFPDDLILCQDIRLYLENLINNSQVSFDASYQPNQTLLEPDLIGTAPIEEGEWLPELNPFFPTLLAEPHIIGYSAGYRSYDKIFKIDCLPVSIGDQFSLYQFKTISKGNIYFGVEACVWAIFEAKAKSLALINADYYIALPLTYIYKNFAARLRIFHQSSHLGDELLMENKKIKRLNPSMEVIDFFVSYNFTRHFTAFAGVSRVIRSDDSYKIKPHGIYYGFNWYLQTFKLHLCNLEAIPYIATYFNNLEENNWKIDSSMAIGYQWDKLYGHKLRIYLEGHEGYSHEGQFSKQKTRYLALKLLYSY